MHRIMKRTYWLSIWYVTGPKTCPGASEERNQTGYAKVLPCEAAQLRSRSNDLPLAAIIGQCSPTMICDNPAATTAGCAI
jgi:hypothetical protein